MTLEDIAKIAKVAPGTARKALRNDPTVRSYLRERVVAAAKKENYRPNMMARSLRQSGSMLVSVVVQELNNPYFGGLAENIINSLHRHGFEAVLTTSVDKVIEHLHSYQSCGCICATGMTESELKVLLQSEKLVTIQSHDCSFFGGPDISIDFSGCYRKLTELALDLKRTKVAFCSNRVMQVSLVDKFETVESVLKSRKLKPLKSYLEGFNSPDELAEFLKANTDSIDTLFCQNDIVAARCMGLISKLGIKVPEDILIVGCDGTLPLAGVWTVKVDLQELAEKAVELFIKLNNSEITDAKLLLPAQIMV